MKSTQHVHPKIDQKNKQVRPEVHEIVKAVFLTDCELVANESGKAHQIKKKVTNKQLTYSMCTSALSPFPDLLRLQN